LNSEISITAAWSENRMSRREELIKLINEQVKIENDYVENAANLEKLIDNVAAKLLLRETRLDSSKHAGILNGILEMLKGIPTEKTLWNYQIETYSDQLAVKERLKNHIKIETEMLAQVEKEIRHTDDEGIRLLLEHIAEDEKKHHKILTTVIKNFYKIE
jgi:bacterioferritin (cytochrome b1)